MVTGYTPRVDPKSGARIVDYRLVSGDSHMAEPGDLWTSRIDKEFRERAIHLESREDGDWYYCEGTRLGGLSTMAYPGYVLDKGKRETLSLGRNVYAWGEGLRFKDVRPGGHDPDERIKDDDLDGIEKEIIFPTTAGGMWRGIVDSRLLSAHVRAYNDYIAEFSKAHPDRLYGLGTLNVDDVQEAVGELRRCHRMGLVGAMIPSGPPASKLYLSPDYEPLWATAEDSGMPLTLHVATFRATTETGALPWAKFVQDKEASYAGSFSAFEATRSTSQLILSGVLERHPKLQIGVIETGLAWAVPALQMLDKSYKHRPQMAPTKFRNAMVPSDFFHRQMFVGYQDDEVGIQLRHFIGVDNIQWGSDYPHTESTWPRSRDILEENLRECTQGEKAKIAGANVARVFHLDSGS